MKDCEKDDVPYPPLLPRKVNLQEVTIIPHNEWERIRGSLDKLTREAAALRAERTAKRRMHTQSQNLVKHWTNTYAGMKEQKLKAKQKRGEELEAERQILDVEEELHKEGERKKAIESAKQYQFYQTERVKSFHVLSGFSSLYIYVYLTCIVNSFLYIIIHSFLKIVQFFCSQDFFSVEL